MNIIWYIHMIAHDICSPITLLCSIYNIIYIAEVNEKFDNMISILQRDVNELQTSLLLSTEAAGTTEQPISPDDTNDYGDDDSNSSRPTKKRRRRGVRQDDNTADNDSLDSSSDCSNDELEVYNKGVDNNENDDQQEEGSIASKFSYISTKSNHKEQYTEQSDASSDDEEEDTNSKRTKKNEEVIDLAGSSSSSSSSDSSSDESEEQDDDSVAIGKGKLKDDTNDNSEEDEADDEDEEEDLTFDTNNGGGLASDDEQESTLGNNNDTALELDNNSDKDNEEEDEDDNNGEIERYHISKIKQSKLTMATQGFRCQATAMSNGSTNDDDMTEDDAATAGSNKAKHGTSLEDHTPFDPSSIEYKDKIFHINHCYTLKEGDAIVGIKHFTSKDTAHCVLIVRFEDTLLGTEDEGLEYKADYMLDTHVQVYNCNENICLSKLGDESDVVDSIPRLIYQPQTHGDWYTFGYFYDRNELMLRRIKRRSGSIRSLECFVGAGGSLQGYKNVGFETICAIDNDHDAIATLKLNHPELNTYEGDIKDFKEHVGVIGGIDHIHWSSPCQDFSQANRSLNGSNQVVGNRDRADLSLLLVDYVQLKRPLTAVFENVCGIYQRKNVHYLKNITKRLMQLGYQVRCTVSKACDYGDPQKRPRFFMFISRNNIPMPSIPAPTHGDSPNLWPYVTTKEALDRVNDSLPNMQGRTSSLLPQHGVIRLKPHECAPTIRAGSVTPFHYSKDRCINVREAATLQSFPLDYKFIGSLSSQYKQVGNAVPVELASAVAQSIKQVLMYEYKEEEEEDMASDMY